MPLFIGLRREGYLLVMDKCDVASIKFSIYDYWLLS